jgi:hypothetical protein
MKLFQIEEPDGSPGEESGAGLAIALEVADGGFRVAVAVGGNAEILKDREGNARVAAPDDPKELLLAARAHAEKALARPATHLLLVAEPAVAERLAAAAPAAGLVLLDSEPRQADADAALAAAACRAEDAAAAAA